MTIFKYRALVVVNILLTSVVKIGHVTAVNFVAVGDGDGNPQARGDVAVGGFAQSCSSWGGSYGNVDGKGIAIIQATCRTTAGTSKTSTINLDQCYANDNGNMNCRLGGGFGGSCSVDNTLSTGNTILAVTCRITSGGSNHVSVDVNLCVGNLDGTLAC